MPEGNQYIRVPVGGGGDSHTIVRITAVNAGLGRREYTGNILRYRTSGSPKQLNPVSPIGKEVKFFNMLESTTGTNFLEVNDEVVVWPHSSFLICKEFPRGYV